MLTVLKSDFKEVNSANQVKNYSETLTLNSITLVRGKILKSHKKYTNKPHVVFVTHFPYISLILLTSHLLGLSESLFNEK